MARTRTLTNLITDVRRAGNVESHAVAFPDPEIAEYINKGIERYSNIIRKARGGELDKSKSTATTTSGVSAIAFSSFTPSMAALAQILSVYATANGSTYELHRLQPEQRPMLEDTSLSWSGQPLYYDRRQSTIDILPAPGAGYTIAVWWRASATRLVNGSDTFDGIDGWENLVIKWAAREIARKLADQALYAMLSTEIAEASDEIASALPSLDTGEPVRVRDLRGVGRRTSPWRRVR